jgi:hypothetical protein
MSYPGVPEELTKEMDSCVSKMTKGGKGKSAAVAMCKLSLTNRKVPKEKEKPYRTVASKDTHYVFSSTSKIDTKAEGTLVKNIEIFKAGTFKGIEFKVSGLDKMVANFHYLKEFNIFPNVPMRADHPSWMEGGKIDKVGGYIADLRRVGTKLVADVRTTSADMLEKIQDGTYISRSAEIGMYEDNKGNIYNPILYGFAWVDIPAVEGLSPQFSFSKEAVNLVNLNSNMGEEKQFPPVEEQEEEKKETTEESTEEKTEETKEEVTEEKEEKIIEASKTIEVAEFAKAFPVEFAAFEAAKVELAKAKEAELVMFVQDLVKEGKITPVLVDQETSFVKSLSTEQFAQYETIKKESPAIVKFDAEQIEAGDGGQEKDGSSSEPTATEKADEFLKEIK